MGPTQRYFGRSCRAVPLLLALGCSPDAGVVSLSGELLEGAQGFVIITEAGGRLLELRLVEGAALPSLLTLAPEVERVRVVGYDMPVGRIFADESRLQALNEGEILPTGLFELERALDGGELWAPVERSPALQEFKTRLRTQCRRLADRETFEFAVPGRVISSTPESPESIDLGRILVTDRAERIWIPFTGEPGLLPPIEHPLGLANPALVGASTPGREAHYFFADGSIRLEGPLGTSSLLVPRGAIRAGASRIRFDIFAFTVLTEDDQVGVFDEVNWTFTPIGEPVDDRSLVVASRRAGRTVVADPGARTWFSVEDSGLVSKIEIPSRGRPIELVEWEDTYSYEIFTDQGEIFRESGERLEPVRDFAPEVPLVDADVVSSDHTTFERFAIDANGDLRELTSEGVCPPIALGLRVEPHLVIRKTTIIASGRKTEGDPLQVVRINAWMK